MKNLQNSAYILFIGLSPLICQYAKKNIDSSSFARKIKNDILLKHQIQLKKKEKNQNKDLPQDNDYITMKEVQQSIKQSKSESKLSQKQKQQLQSIKQWMKVQLNINMISVQKNIAISMIHVLGGYFSPNVFFFSICGYFVLSQVSFVRQFFGIKNGVKVQNTLTFDQLNTIYLGMSGIALGLIGGRLGIQKLSKKACK